MKIDGNGAIKKGNLFVTLVNGFFEGEDFAEENGTEIPLDQVNPKVTYDVSASSYLGYNVTGLNFKWSEIPIFLFREGYRSGRIYIQRSRP